MDSTTDGANEYEPESVKDQCGNQIITAKCLDCKWGMRQSVLYPYIETEARIHCAKTGHNIIVGKTIRRKRK